MNGVRPMQRVGWVWAIVNELAELKHLPNCGAWSCLAVVCSSRHCAGLQRLFEKSFA